MMRLTDKLQVELDELMGGGPELDHGFLQQQGRRRRRRRQSAIAFGTVVGVALLAAVTVSLPSSPVPVEVMEQPNEVVSDELDAAEPSETYEEWYERKFSTLQVAIAQAPASQAEVLSDGVVTPDELASARSGFGNCMRAAGHDITLNADGSYAIELGEAAPTVEEESQLERDDARCWDAHLSAIVPLWEWQEMDHREAWRTTQDQATRPRDATGSVEEMQEVNPGTAPSTP